MGSLKFGCLPVKVFRKATILAFSSAVNVLRKGGLNTQRLIAATSDTFRPELLGLVQDSCDRPVGAGDCPVEGRQFRYNRAFPLQPSP